MFHVKQGREIQKHKVPKSDLERQVARFRVRVQETYSYPAFSLWASLGKAPSKISAAKFSPMAFDTVRHVL